MTIIAGKISANKTIPVGSSPSRILSAALRCQNGGRWQNLPQHDYITKVIDQTKQKEGYQIADVILLAAGSENAGTAPIFDKFEEFFVVRRQYIGYTLHDSFNGSNIQEFLALSLVGEKFNLVGHRIEVVNCIFG